MLSALLTTTRVGVGSLSARLGPLAAIQTSQLIGACVQQQQATGRWPQPRGFAAGPPPGNDGSDGSRPASRAAEQQAPQHAAAAAAAEQQSKVDQDPAQPQAQQEQAATSAAPDGGGAAGSGEQQRQQEQEGEGQEQEPPKLALEHPELKEYIEGLQKLKGECDVQAWLRAFFCGWHCHRAM